MGQHLDDREPSQTTHRLNWLKFAQLSREQCWFPEQFHQILHGSQIKLEVFWGHTFTGHTYCVFVFTLLVKKKKINRGLFTKLILRLNLRISGSPKWHRCAEKFCSASCRSSPQSLSLSLYMMRIPRRALEHLGTCVRSWIIPTPAVNCARTHHQLIIGPFYRERLLFSLKQLLQRSRAQRAFN